MPAGSSSPLLARTQWEGQGVTIVAFIESTWGVSATFKDRDGNVSSVQTYYPGGNIFADVEAAALVFANSAASLSDCVVTQYSASKVWLNDQAAVTIPPEIADVERKGFFSFQLSDTRQTSLSIPGIKNTLVIDGTNQINRADVAVAAFIAALEAGTTDSIGTDVVRVLKAEKRHRGSRKG